jgi:translation initiation factor 2B subunit (eIF-2B alpha/beta/delta family)
MNIEDDNLSGASILTERALTYIYKLADKKYSTRDEFLSALKKECLSIARSQKSMVSLQNELSRVLKSAEKGEDLVKAQSNAKICAKERLQFLKKAETNIIYYGISLIREGCTVLTLSRSSIVEKILVHAYEKIPFFVIVSESRPNYEGRLLAESLNDKEIPVTLIVDAAATLFSPDIVLVGADSVTPNFLINKVGTKFLATSFPTYVACCTNKFTKKKIMIEEKDPDEVLPGGDRYENLHVKNYYFDGTPLDCIRGFITEYGILSPEKVRSLLQ